MSKRWALLMMSLVIALGYKMLIIGEAADGSVQLWFNPVATDDEIRSALARNPQAVNEYNGEGLTGLMVAAMQSNYDRVKLLLELNADPTLGSIKPNDQGFLDNTALHFVVPLGDNLNNQTNGPAQIIDMLLNASMNPRIPNANPNAKNSNVEVPAQDMNQIKGGETPIHRAQYIQLSSQIFPILHNLVNRGGDINAQNNAGNTLAHLFVQLNRIDDMGTLVQQFPQLNLNVRNKMGLTPLGYAETLGFGQMADVLRGVTRPVGVNPTVTDTYQFGTK